MKDYPEKHRDKTSVKRPTKRFEAFGTMERQKGPSRPQTATTLEKEETVEEMICSQEDHPATHVPPHPKNKYCRGIKDLKIFCAENDQKKRNKTIQTSQNTLNK